MSSSSQASLQEGCTGDVTQTHTEEDNLKVEAETGVMWPQVQGMPVATRS